MIGRVVGAEWAASISDEWVVFGLMLLFLAAMCLGAAVVVASERRRTERLRDEVLDAVGRADRLPDGRELERRVADFRRQTGRVVL